MIILISSVKQANPFIVLIHDGALSHFARKTTDALQLAGIETIIWPPNSLVLKPNGCVWNIMEIYIQNYYAKVAARTQILELRLRKSIGNGWESITSVTLSNLIFSMPARCLFVLEAN